MPPLSPPQTAYGLVYVGDPNVGKEQDNDRKKKSIQRSRSFVCGQRPQKEKKQKKNKKCTKGCYVLRV
jgi:hypothetical protein